MHGARRYPCSIAFWWRKTVCAVGMAIIVSLGHRGAARKHEGDQQRLGHVRYRGQQPLNGFSEYGVISPKWRPPSSSLQIGEVRTTPPPARAIGRVLADGTRGFAGPWQADRAWATVRTSASPRNPDFMTSSIVENRQRRKRRGSQTAVRRPRADALASAAASHSRKREKSRLRRIRCRVGSRFCDTTNMRPRRLV
jgi:hypothetical protein